MHSYDFAITAQRCKLARAKKGLTQEALARLAGVGNQTVCRIEQARGIRDVGVFVAIAAHLDCSLGHLLGVDDAPAKRRRKPDVGGA